MSFVLHPWQLLLMVAAGWVNQQQQQIIDWHRELIAQKWDYSKQREKKPGRPPTSQEITALVLQMAHENPSWGYDRIQGALGNLGHDVSDQTVGNILKEHGIERAPERKRQTTWKTFIPAASRKRLQRNAQAKQPQREPDIRLAGEGPPSHFELQEGIHGPTSVSPPRRVLRARSVIIEIVSETNRTEPSHIEKLAPPGWLLPKAQTRRSM
jgi:hypothetical protein